MIILSGVLVVAAIALLVTGIVTGNGGHELFGSVDGLKLIYVSIGISIVSALCLAVGVFLRRKELFGTAAAVPAAAKAKGAKANKPAKTKARVGAGADVPTPMASATATDVPGETTVYVVPGRKRYHLETCRQLAGRDKEELTFVEAREEGFSACTACLPDTALAARAAIAESEETAAEATTEPVADTVEVPEQRTDSEPAAVTLTDIPVTKPEDAALATPEPEDKAEDDSDTLSASEAATDTEDTPAENSAGSIFESVKRTRSLFEPLPGDAAPADEESPADADAPADDAKTDVEPDTEPDAETPDPAEATIVEPAGDKIVAGHPADEPTPDAETDEATEPTAEESPTTTSDTATETEEQPADKADTSPEEPADEPTDATTEPTEKSEEDQPKDQAADPADDQDQADPTDEEPAVQDAPPSTQTVRILSGTKRYHRSNCALIEDIADDADDLESLPVEEAKARGCTPCLVCQPDKDPADLD